MDRSRRVETDEEVLASFGEGEYRTVGEVAERTGLSLSSVRESIERLEEAGYRWERHPERGLLLRERTGLLIESEVTPHLETEWVGRALHIFRSTESTNDLLLSDTFAGAPPGTVILTEEQSRGRGRLGRSWEALPFKALLFSVLLRPSGGAAVAAQSTLTAGLAVLEGVRESGGPPLHIRWPNDLVSGEKKVCGILSEFRPQSDSLVIGIGLNVNQEDEELLPVGNSLRELEGKSFSRGPLLAAILNRLEVWVDQFEGEGFESIRSEAERHSAVVGRVVTLDMGGTMVKGRAIGIGLQGGLQLQTSEGEKEYLTGEVTRVVSVERA